MPLTASEVQTVKSKKTQRGSSHHRTNHGITSSSSRRERERQRQLQKKSSRSVPFNPKLLEETHSLYVVLQREQRSRRVELSSPDMIVLEDYLRYNHPFLFDQNLKSFDEPAIPIVEGIDDNNGQVQNDISPEKDASTENANEILSDGDSGTLFDDSASEIRALLYAAHLYDTFDSKESALEEARKIQEGADLLRFRKSKVYTKNTENFEHAMDSIDALKNDIFDALKLCSAARLQLKNSVANTTGRGADILLNATRRNNLMQVQEVLLKIQELKDLERKAREAIEHGNITECHTFCMEFEKLKACSVVVDPEAESIVSEMDSSTSSSISQNAMSKKNQNAACLGDLKCVQSLAQKVKLTALESQQKLQGETASICKNFQSDLFNKLFQSYKDIAIEDSFKNSLVSEYINTIGAVGKDVTETPRSGKGVPQHYQLPKKVDDVIEFVSQCLHDFTDIFTSYYLMLKYISDLSNSISLSVQEQNVYRDLFKSFAAEKASMCQICENHAAEIVLAYESKLSRLKPQSFASLYNRTVDFFLLMEVFRKSTREFNLDEERDILSPQDLLSRSSDKSLLGIMRRISENGFETMHKQNLELIKVMLKNETWQRCKVNMVDLVNIRNFIQIEGIPQGISSQESQSLPANCHKFVTPADGLNAFNEGRNLLREKARADKLPHAASIQLPPATEHDLDEVDWAGSKIFTPSSLAALRWVSRYVQIGTEFPTCRNHTAQAVADVFLLYVSYVITIFDRNRSHPALLELDGRTEVYTLRHMADAKDKLAILNLQNGLKNMGPDCQKIYKIPQLSVALESFWTLSVMVEPLERYLKECTDRMESKVSVSRLTSNALELKDCIRNAGYRALSQDVIGGYKMQRLVEKTTFEMVEDAPVDKASGYVDVMISRIKHVANWDPPLSNATAEKLWPTLCYAFMDFLLDRYADASRCTVRGRSQMLVDVRVLEQTLESACGLRPVPGASRVETYVKLFYFNEEDIKKWLESNEPDNLNLTRKQIVSLLLVGIGKKLSPSEKTSMLQKMMDIRKKAKQRRIDKADGKDAIDPENVREKEEMSDLKTMTTESNLDRNESGPSGAQANELASAASNTSLVDLDSEAMESKDGKEEDKKAGEYSVSKKERETKVAPADSTSEAPETEGESGSVASIKTESLSKVIGSKKSSFIRDKSRQALEELDDAVRVLCDDGKRSMRALGDDEADDKDISLLV